MRTRREHRKMNQKELAELQMLLKSQSKEFSTKKKISQQQCNDTNRKRKKETNSDQREKKKVKRESNQIASRKENAISNTVRIKKEKLRLKAAEKAKVNSKRNEAESDKQDHVSSQSKNRIQEYKNNQNGNREEKQNGNTKHKAKNNNPKFNKAKLENKLTKVSKNKLGNKQVGNKRGLSELNQTEYKNELKNFQIKNRNKEARCNQLEDMNIISKSKQTSENKITDILYENIVCSECKLNFTNINQYKDHVCSSVGECNQPRSKEEETFKSNQINNKKEDLKNNRPEISKGKPTTRQTRKKIFKPKSSKTKSVEKTNKKHERNRKVDLKSSQTVEKKVVTFGHINCSKCKINFTTIDQYEDHACSSVAKLVKCNRTGKAMESPTKYEIDKKQDKKNSNSEIRKEKVKTNKTKNKRVKQKSNSIENNGETKCKQTVNKKTDPKSNQKGKKKAVTLECIEYSECKINFTTFDQYKNHRCSSVGEHIKYYETTMTEETLISNRTRHKKEDLKSTIPGSRKRKLETNQTKNKVFNSINKQTNKGKISCKNIICHDHGEKLSADEESSSSVSSKCSKLVEGNKKERKERNIAGPKSIKVQNMKEKTQKETGNKNKLLKMNQTENKKKIKNNQTEKRNISTMCTVLEKDGTAKTKNGNIVLEGFDFNVYRSEGQNIKDAMKRKSVEIAVCHKCFGVFHSKTELKAHECNLAKKWKKEPYANNTTETQISKKGRKELQPLPTYPYFPNPHYSKSRSYWCRICDIDFNEFSDFDLHNDYHFYY